MIAIPHHAPVVAADLTAGPLCRLIAAQAAVSDDDLTLPDLLERIAAEARTLVGAATASLAIDGRAVAGAADTGDRSAADRRAGLTVAIRAQGRVYADLTVHAGPDGFDEQAETLLGALASTAGTAIAHARLLEDAARNAGWLRATAEVSRAVLAGGDVDALLDVVTEALHAADADFGLLVLPDAEGTMRATVVVGEGTEQAEEITFAPGESELSRLMALGEPLIAPSLAGFARADVPSDRVGPVMMAPLVDSQGLRGSVVLMRATGRREFDHAEFEMLTTFADQVALALELDEARTSAERLEVLEVRHGIAQQLHDNVIQRLFAIGMGLHSLSESELPDTVRQRLSRHVADLDDTIDETRERVFGLRRRSADVPPAGGRFPRVTRSVGPRATGARGPGVDS